MLGTEHHESDTEDSIGSCGKNLETRHRLRVELRHIGLRTRQHIGVALHVEQEPHRGTFRAANPVALDLLQRVGPIHLLQPVDQTLGVGRDAEAPLTHQLALHGVAATHREAVHHLVVGQHSAQLGAPIHGDIGQVGQAVVHQHLLTTGLVPRAPLFGREDQSLRAGGGEAVGTLLGKAGLELADGQRLAGRLVIIMLEQLQESPLRPLVVLRVAGTHLAVPVEREPNLVQLLAVAGNIPLRRNGGMLTRLDGILLGGQAIGVVTHRMQHIEAPQTLVACIDVARNIAQRMAHMQTRSRRIGKHIQNIVVRLGRSVAPIRSRHLSGVRNMVYAMLPPIVLPPWFNFSEVVVHFHSVFYNGHTL